MTQNSKPVIIQVINDLGAGGAERLLVGLLKDLALHYDVVIVTLRPRTDFPETELVCKARYTIGFTGMKNIVGAVKKLRAIIRKHSPVLVSSHLYWSTIIARLACPKEIPFVFTVHQVLSEGAYKFNKKGIILKWLDKLTYNKRQTMIGVSGEVVKDYDKEIGLKGERHVLHNYVTDPYFEQGPWNPLNNSHVKFVAVGNPKWEKNFEGLIRVMKKIQNGKVSCDIYGESSYSPILASLVSSLNAPVNLKGRSEKVFELLPGYDAFVMSSYSEGFGIAAAEAMAVGLPVVASDLGVLKEVTKGNAIFFDPRNENEFAEKLQAVAEDKFDLKSLSQKGREIALKNYTRQAYVNKLLAIYNEAIEHEKSVK
jgi:glycosyltransferase involved in cell wall biosynthesis